MKRTISSIATMAVVGLLTLQAIGETLYKVTDLGDLPNGSDASNGFAINSVGRVVGISSTNAVLGGSTVSREHAFLWTRSGGMHDLGSSFAGASEAHGINDAGQIAGTYFTYAPGSTTQNGNHAVLWTNSGDIQELGHLPGDDSSTAMAINKYGQVVGDSRIYSAQGSVDHAFIWSSSDGMQYLGDLPGGTDVSYAVAINDMGEVTGTASSASGSRAFRWTSTGGMQNLGGLPGGTGFSQGTGISNSGAIIGYGIAQNATHAFLWRSDTGMQNLGGSRSFAWGINSYDVVVGQVRFGSSSINNDHAFIWTDTGGLKDLNSMLDSSGVGWTLNIAHAINDAGQIAGVGRNPNGARHAFLLTPVPEPPAIVVAALGVLGIVGMRWRSQ